MEKLDEGAPTPNSRSVEAPSTDADASLTTEPTVNELKAEISQTQGQLRQTLTEIQERLSPAHLAEQAKNTVRDATVGRVTDMAERVGDTASRIAEQTRRAASGLPRPVRNNPWPLALIGVGVAWLLVRSRSQEFSGDWRGDDNWAGNSFGANDRRHREYSEYSDHREGSTAPASSPVAVVTDRLRDVASDASQRARELSRDTQYRLSRTMHDNPMVLGAVAVAAGALIGTLMPRSDVEDAYMGEARDSVVDSAREMVDSAREMAEDKVQELSNVVRDGSRTANTPGASSSPSY